MIVKQSFRVKILLMFDPVISEKHQTMNMLFVGYQATAWESFSDSNIRCKSTCITNSYRGKQTINTGSPFFCLGWFLSWHGCICRDYTVSCRVNLEHLICVSSSKVSAETVHITWFDLRPTHKAPVELALSASSHGQKQTSLPLMKRENRWSRQKSKMKCAAIYSQWLSDCNRSQCHLSVSYLSYNDKPNSWWTNAQTGQRYSTEGTARISPINQRTINSDRKGTRDLAKSWACYCDALFKLMPSALPIKHMKKTDVQTKTLIC